MKAMVFRIVICSVFFVQFYIAQVGNYVSNGSFELNFVCASGNALTKNIKFWNSLDSANAAIGGLYTNRCNNSSNFCCSIPLNAYSYQQPRTGDAFELLQVFCNNPNYCNPPRGFLKNRLKLKLDSGKVYCAKMHVNSVENCRYSVDKLSLYFADSYVDTISTPNVAIPYITPQVYSNLIIYDTLNWVPITGTFVASGKETYLVLGLFASDANVTFSVTNPTHSAEWSGYNIDDVSCIPLDLPAYAGPDKMIAPGDSAYIGRESDFAIDPGCRWYKLPDLTTAIDTISGLWVKPAVTTTYVVRQELDCSTLKWDTVVIVVNNNLASIEQRAFMQAKLVLQPNPANNYISLQTDLSLANCKLEITDIRGAVLIEQTLSSELTHAHTLSTNDLEDGLYFLRIQDSQRTSRVVKFVVER
jgi:hypothetical protein